MEFTANELLKEAIEQLNNIRTGEVFIVKDLFRGYIWNRVPKNERLLLGTLFLNYIKTEKADKVFPDGKNSSGQQKYKLA